VCPGGQKGISEKSQERIRVLSLNFQGMLNRTRRHHGHPRMSKRCICNISGTSETIKLELSGNMEGDDYNIYL